MSVRTFGSGEKAILIVEDDNSSYCLVEFAFEEIGGDFQLHRVVDGQEALDFLRRSGCYVNAPRPKLMLLNLNLPKLGGIEVLHAMHHDGTIQDVPALVFSSSKLDRDKALCLALGARAFLTKPLHLDEFVKPINLACSYA